MALISCPECGENLSTLAKSCPHCGCPMAEHKSEAKYSLSSQDEKPSGKYTVDTIAFKPDAPNPFDNSDKEKRQNNVVVSVNGQNLTLTDDRINTVPTVNGTYHMKPIHENTSSYEEKKVTKPVTNAFKRVISWIVLFIVIIAVEFLTSIVISGLGELIAAINKMSLGAKLIIYIFGGTTLASLLIYPVYYGYVFIIGISEAISPTKSGLRYIVVGGYNLISEIGYAIEGIANGFTKSNIILSIIMCVFYIALIATGIKFSSER